MAFIVLLALCAAAATADKTKDYYRKLESTELSEARRSETFANDALTGMYADCFTQVSFSCVQKKVLNFINRINRMEKFSVLGNYVSVVRTKDEYEAEPAFEARLLTAEQESTLDQLMETAVDRFFNSHIIRLRVPNTFTLKSAGSRSSDETTALDFRFPYSDEVEGRKKGGGGGGKMGKKMMMMMMMGLKAKMMMLGPMMLGLAGLMAMKALIAGVISLTISKIMILKKLMKNKGGGGGGHGGGHGSSSGGWESSGGGGSGGWSSGGDSGGGWDRRSAQQVYSQGGSWSPSDLAYSAYSTVESLL